tara:strand:- start:469 stop:1347 length:879 start_codon:yes stop_codon:yes gene_type:complete
MRTAIIVNNAPQNSSLLRFTQTKLFFDAYNVGYDYFEDCITVDTYEEAEKIAKGNDVILETGDYLTTSFRNKHKYSDNVVYARDSDQVYKFDKNLPIDYATMFTELNKPVHKESKQRFIIHNMLKIVVKSKNKIWLEQTEQYNIPYYKECKHFYGLASAWKSMLHCVEHDYETYTIYDYCEPQLEFAKALQSQMSLPETLEVENANAEWNPPQKVKDNWAKWHSMDIKFEKINLFDTPIFPKHSLIWVSNAFHYEPTMFTFGYDKVKYLKNQLAEKNSDSIITTTAEDKNYG